MVESLANEHDLIDAAVRRRTSIMGRTAAAAVSTDSTDSALSLRFARNRLADAHDGLSLECVEHDAELPAAS